MTIDRLKTHLGSVLLASLLLSLLQPAPLPAQAGSDEEEPNPSAKAIWKPYISLSVLLVARSFQRKNGLEPVRCESILSLHSTRIGRLTVPSYACGI